MSDDAHERGMKVRREVLGDEHVDRAVERTSDFTADFQDFITRYAWGEIWTRPGLDRRMRSAITMTALIGVGRFDELGMHVRAALRNGLTVGRDQGGPAAERDLLRRARGQLGVRGRPEGARGGGQGMSESVTVAVLGLGEAGGAIAADLVAGGARVVGWDPAGGDVDGIEFASDDRAAVAGSDLVLSVNWARVAVEAAESAASVLGEGQLYADLNTGSPGMKRAVADVIAGTGAAFADVALMAPVPGRGVRTPALAAGAGAPLFARVMVGFGMPVTLLDSEPGAAAARKLVRSVYVKGMTAALGEALEASERLGCLDWLADDIARTLDEADAEFADRLLERKPAARPAADGRDGGRGRDARGARRGAADRDRRARPG